MLVVLSLYIYTQRCWDGVDKKFNELVTVNFTKESLLRPNKHLNLISKILNIIIYFANSDLCGIDRREDNLIRIYN